MSAVRTSRREYLIALVLLAVGGVLGLSAASRPWGSARLPSSLSVTSTSVSGSDLLPFAPAVSLVAVAAVVAVPAVRRLGRRVVGGVVAALGAALAVTALLAVLDLRDRIETWVVSSPGTSSPVSEVSTSPAWGLAVVAAGLLVLASGLMIAARGHTWPAMGSKYERPVKRDEPRRDAPEPTAEARATWDALDRGDDPT